MNQLDPLTAVPAAPGTYSLFVDEEGKLAIDEPIVAWAIEQYFSVAKQETTYTATPVGVTSSEAKWVLFHDGRVSLLHCNDFDNLDEANSPSLCAERIKK